MFRLLVEIAYVLLALLALLAFASASPGSSFLGWLVRAIQS
jgi:hypothetical protein